MWWYHRSSSPTGPLPKNGRMEGEVWRGRERRERLNGEEPFRVLSAAGLRAHFRQYFAAAVVLAAAAG